MIFAGSIGKFVGLWLKNLKMVIGNYFLIVSPFLWFKQKKSSSAHSVLCKFKEKMNVPHTIEDCKFEKSTFSIMVYYKKENINVNNEINFLNYVYVKHNLKRFNFLPFEVVQIISIQKINFST